MRVAWGLMTIMTNKKAIMWARTSQDSSAAAATDDDDDAQIAPTQRWGNT